VMPKTTHTFKIRQQVYHVLPGRMRGTGPYTSDGTILYRIKSSMREKLADETELKLALRRKRLD
jgi:hypothetical protein